MIPFELAEPRSLREAVNLLDPGDDTVRPIAGGTALMLMMKAGVFQPKRLISLRRIEPEFSRLNVAANGQFEAGALVPLSTLERTAAVRQHFPIIAQTLRTLSNVRVRNVATIGGHLAHADPHMDLPPVLGALGAKVVITGPLGTRQIAVEDLFSGYYETVLARNELISKLIVPAPTHKRSAYIKVTTRSADDWPALGIAVSLDMDGDTVRNADIFVSAVTEKPTRATLVETVLRGASINNDVLRRAGEAAADDGAIVADARGTIAYKKQLLRVYMVRVIGKALAADSSAERRRS